MTKAEDAVEYAQARANKEGQEMVVWSSAFGSRFHIARAVYRDVEEVRDGFLQIVKPQAAA